MAQTKGVRRVVTTHDASGKAVVGFDDVRPVSGGEPELGVEVYNFWITDENSICSRRGSARPWSAFMM